jgi:phosphopantetheine--protein transferase-like protein
MMGDRDVLKEVVSELYRAPSSAIGADFSLRHPRFSRSAGRGILAAAIQRRFGFYVPQAFSAATYGELESALFGVDGKAAGEPANGDVGGGHHVRTALNEPPVGTAPGAALSVGVDIEMIENLPDVGDYWTSDFYRTHFTGAEIAYCIRQEHPRMHFAARWCAKEALAKCDPRFLTVDPATLQVSLEENGRPVLEWIRGKQVERLPHALSLTHTPLLAAAVVAAHLAPIASTVSR